MLTIISVASFNNHMYECTNKEQQKRDEFHETAETIPQISLYHNVKMRRDVSPISLEWTCTNF